MALALRRYRKTLLSSGLLAPAELRAFERSLARNERPTTPQGLSQALVEAGKLSPFQAAEIRAGRTGLVLGNYCILERIGAGGMGQVFKARHRLMDRVVALKTLPNQAMAGEDSIARFRREVLSAAKLSHPNIVAAYDADVSGQVHFLVMEYIEGQNLADVVRQLGPLPLPVAVGYVLDAARGLAYAHDRGIVHRDVKPSNLIVDALGTVKVLDLGLARTASAGAELTMPGDVVGTLEYMAPEQATGCEVVDGRADIYGLGCTLYRLATGELPYRGGSPLELVAAHREQAIPSLRAARDDAPRSLESIFKRMVAKDAGQRFQTMKEVIAALEKLRLADRRSVARPSQSGVAQRPASTCPPEQKESSGDDLLVVPTAVSRRALHAEAASMLQPGRHQDDVHATTSVNSPGKAASAVDKPGPSAPPVSPMVALVALVAALAGIMSLLWFESKPDGDAADMLAKVKNAAAYASAREWSQAWAESLGVPVSMNNSLGMEFVLIPPHDAASNRQGSGGSPSPDRMSEPFYYSVYELTVAQFRQFEAATGYRRVALGQGDRHPIADLAAADAEAFCHWLRQRENASYRLPTYAEWAHACRAGAASQWWFGDNDADLARYAWYESNSAGRTHQVGLLDTNPFGLYDLIGNAAEWCLAGEQLAKAGPITALQPDAGRYALCGGSWSSTAAAIQAGDGRRVTSGGAGGVRLVLELPLEARWPRRGASLPRSRHKGRR